MTTTTSPDRAGPAGPSAGHPAATPAHPQAHAAGRGAPDMGRERPRVSVVVPTFHRPELLSRCLAALIAQTLPPEDYEILVVDDGRDPVTRVQVESLAARLQPLVLRLLRPPPGRHGPAAARNTGWQAARGDLVAFTDDDTVAAADWLDQGLRAMAAHGGLALGGRVIVPRDRPDLAPTDHERMTMGLQDAAFVTANAFVRRDALVRVRGFDEHFERAWREDSDLQFRLEDEGGGRAAVGRCEEAVVLHPVRPEAPCVSLRQQRNVVFDALLYRKHPRRYRERVRPVPPWSYYAIVALAVGTAVLAAAGIWGSAWVSGAVALLLVGRFARQRLRGTSHAPLHVLEMVVTSALIPFVSVGWRLVGAWRFRTWFL